MKERIGVFDSGVGGLTVLKALTKRMPNENFYYFGDTKNVPYGPRASEDIACLSLDAYNKLKSLGIKLLVIGCNTATVHGLKAIEEKADIPVIGVIDPGVTAAKEKGCKKVLILATDATINSGLIQSLLKEQVDDIEIEGIGAPEMVMAVENGDSENEKGKLAVEKYLKKAKIDPDCVMLSCTHFPALENFIIEYYEEKGKKINIINPAEKSAEIAEKLLKDLGKLELEGGGKIEYFASGDLEKFTSSGNLVLGGDLIIKETKNL